VHGPAGQSQQATAALPHSGAATLLPVRRRPAQTVFSTLLVLIGIWVCLGVWAWHRGALEQELPEQLPDIELVDVSAEELFQHPSFRSRPEGPKTWERISLRFYAEEDGDYTRFLRYRIAPAEVAAQNPQLFAHPARRRRVDDQPPAWWPSAEQGGSSWRVPGWWLPAGRSVSFTERLPDGRWIGAYLSYQPSSRWLHYWEWRRGGLAAPEPQIGLLVAETLAGELSRALLARGHPADDAGWLHAPGLTTEAVDLPPGRLPDGLSGIDALLLPREGQVRFLLALRGIEQATAEALLIDQPMRPLPADGAAPRERWGFALPAYGLPSWFAPGPGPRWAYSLPRLGLGEVDAGRWAGYDRDERTLYVWDWFGPPARGAETDLFPPAASESSEAPAARE